MEGLIPTMGHVVAIRCIGRRSLAVEDNAMKFTPTKFSRTFFNGWRK